LAVNPPTNEAANELDEKQKTTATIRSTINSQQPDQLTESTARLVSQMFLYNVFSGNSFGGIRKGAMKLVVVA